MYCTALYFLVRSQIASRKVHIAENAGRELAPCNDSQAYVTIGNQQAKLPKCDGFASATLEKKDRKTRCVP
jgi:hypothetical protein